ncbi:MAG TPA: gamma carbonic anhydrase family protein [Blastocatellia bacterium]|nr:gamma carbonic anhydrase family protein [Blastocatellia bacterium]
MAPTAFVETSAQVIGDVSLGDRASVWFNCVIRADVNHVRVGHNTNVQDGVVIHVTHDQFPTIIGDCVTIGHSAVVHGCTVGGHSLIGIGAIVLDGAVIEEYSLVAAGSLVAPGTVIPARSLAMGSPARVRRPLTDQELLRIEESWKHYVDLAQHYANDS